MPFIKFKARATLLSTAKVDTPKISIHPIVPVATLCHFFFVLKYAALIEYCCLSHNVLTSNMDGDVSTAY